VTAPAIRATGIGKRYRLGEHHSFGSLRETLVDRLRSIGRTRPDAEKASIWALRDVSFEIAPGEAVGIIGRNGAGKSTLLKVLSRITEPTTGRAEIRGRVGSLLEVGTGFHPELTGRENIFLNGAILGMRRAEIAAKFDEIVAFAEVERFIDTPVKRYSSGMYLRLAFAVAAHLEPEILLVDEVLAVGDAAFQKKCLGKMGEVTGEGRTVIFVSHNIGAIASLCSRCLLIDSGQLAADGSPASVTASYQSKLYPSPGATSDLSGVERYGNGKARFASIAIDALSKEGNPADCLRTGHQLRLTLEIQAQHEVVRANVAVILYDPTGFRIIDVNTGLQGSLLSLAAGERATVGFTLHDVLLKPGVYLIGLWLGRSHVEDIDGIQYVTAVSVEPDPEQPLHSESFPGVYQCAFSHHIQRRARASS